MVVGLDPIARQKVLGSEDWGTFQPHAPLHTLPHSDNPLGFLQGKPSRRQVA